MHTFFHSFIFLKYFLLFKTNLWRHDTCWKHGQKSPLSTEEQKGTHTHTHTHTDEMWLTGQRSTGTCCPETSCWGGSDFQFPPSTIGHQSLSETDLLKDKSHFTIQSDILAHFSPLYFQQTPQQIKLHSEQSVRQFTLMSQLVCYLSIYQALINLPQRG